MDYFSERQIEIVEFSERVYHYGLRHKALNGNLYETKLIQCLREDIPELHFFRGQIRTDGKSSSQFDLIICRADVKQERFLSEVDPYTGVVPEEKCLGVVELKKWGNPRMIAPEGPIERAYTRFKTEFPQLTYLFVSLRFWDRKTLPDQRWAPLSKKLNVDEKFCFFGPADHENYEWEPTPWLQRRELMEKNQHYFGEYQRLVETIKALQRD